MSQPLRDEIRRERELEKAEQRATKRASARPNPEPHFFGGTSAPESRRPEPSLPHQSASPQSTQQPSDPPLTATESPVSQAGFSAAPKGTPTSQNIVETLLGNDGTRGADLLDRSKLAAELAAFLRDRRTKTPLTLSIEGRWGSGKTKFMQMLRESVEKDRIYEDERRLRTVWFNPWRHGSHEELWAAFALTVLEETRKHGSFLKRMSSAIKLTWATMDAGRFIRSAVAVFVLALVVSMAIAFLTPFVEQGWSFSVLLTRLSDPSFLNDLGVPLAVVGPTLALGKVCWWIWKNAGGALRRKIEIHLDRPNYAEKTSFLERFHKDFAIAMKCYTGDEPIVVFIDDLDRCDVPKAAELMQGINLMLGDEAPIIYVLGIDRAKVAAGVAVKHRDLVPYLYSRDLDIVGKDGEAQELRAKGLEHGYEFIEKFIQLPFRLPPSGPGELRKFITGRIELTATPPAGPHPDAGREQRASLPRRPPPDESHLIEPLVFAAQIMEGNPRRIAQLINLVRLQRRLAPLLGVEVGDGQLAKWTAVALRWPLFLSELEHEPELLEQLVSPVEPTGPSTRYRRWNAQKELVDFLRARGAAPHDDTAYDLTANGAINALLRLGVAVPVAEVGAKKP